MIPQNKERITITLDKKTIKNLDKIKHLDNSKRSTVINNLINFYSKDYYKFKKMKSKVKEEIQKKEYDKHYK